MKQCYTNSIDRNSYDRPLKQFSPFFLFIISKIKVLEHFQRPTLAFLRGPILEDISNTGCWFQRSDSKWFNTRVIIGKTYS